MRLYTVHVREGRAPVLVPERFSLGAAVLGPVWLLWHRAWVPAALVLSAVLLLWALGAAWRLPCLGALAVWVGMSGNDMRRWSLARGRFALSHVVAGPDAAAARLRLYDAQPGLRLHEAQPGLRGAVA